MDKDKTIEKLEAENSLLRHKNRLLEVRLKEKKLLLEQEYLETRIRKIEWENKQLKNSLPDGD